ncbi:hydrophobin family protein [Streptomyces sp. NBC_00341]|uniref:hydrophobin family protein n=1 Tax=unclassified Streptomyces TaxID=2593676 RepID=UPI00308AF9B3|nr:hydrophobin family protein [Streptomyces sp. NBC_00341]
MTRRLAACATAVAALTIAFGGAAHADVNTEFQTTYTGTGSGESPTFTCEGTAANGLVNVGCSPISL